MNENRWISDKVLDWAVKEAARNWNGFDRKWSNEFRAAASDSITNHNIKKLMPTFIEFIGTYRVARGIPDKNRPEVLKQTLKAFRQHLTNTNRKSAWIWWSFVRKTTPLPLKKRV